MNVLHCFLNEIWKKEELLENGSLCKAGGGGNVESERVIKICRATIISVLTFTVTV